MGVQDTLSAIFFGFVVGTALFGVVSLEAYRYFKTYKKDPLGQRLMVAFICGLDVLHFSFSIHMAYHYLISTFGDPAPFLSQELVWSARALGVVQVALLWIVQCLYLQRIWTLTRRTLHRRQIVLPVLSAVILIALIALGAGLLFIIEISRIGSILDYTETKWVVILALAVSATVDLAIAAIITVLLHRSITGMKSTDGVLSALIHYFISTGLLTSLAAFIYIILYAVASKTLLYMSMIFVVSRLYTISFLELLNVRKQLREDLQATGPLGLELSPIRMNFGVKEWNPDPPKGVFSIPQTI